MIIKESQFKELLGHLVKEIMTELASADPIAPMSQSSLDTSATGTSTASPLDTATQKKIEREKKSAAKNDLKISKKTYDQGVDQEKADEKRVQINKRIKLPQLKTQIQAQQQALRSM